MLRSFYMVNDQRTVLCGSLFLSLWITLGCDRLTEGPSATSLDKGFNQAVQESHQEGKHANSNTKNGVISGAGESTVSLDVNLSVNGQLPSYQKTYNPMLRLAPTPEDLPEGDRIVSYNVSVDGCQSTKRQAVEVVPQIGILSAANDPTPPANGIKLDLGDQSCQVKIDKISFCSLEFLQDLKPCQDFYPSSEHTISWTTGEKILFETHDRDSNIYVNVLRQIDPVISGAQYVLFNLMTVDQGDSVVLQSFYVQSFASVIENSQIDLALKGKNVSIAPNGHGLFNFTFECSGNTVGDDNLCSGDDVSKMTANLVNSDPEGTGSEDIFYDSLKNNIDSCLNYLEKDADALGGNLKESLSVIPGHVVQGVSGQDVVVEKGGGSVQIRGSLRPLMSREKSIKELIDELTPLYSDRHSLERSLEMIEENLETSRLKKSDLEADSSLSEADKKTQLAELSDEIEVSEGILSKVKVSLDSTQETIRHLEQGYTALSELTLNSVKYLLVLGSHELKKCKIWPITVEVPQNRTRHKHYGCMDSKALNFDYLATDNDGSCRYEVLGCTQKRFANYDPQATTDNGSCAGARLCDVHTELKIEEIDPSANRIVFRNHSVMKCSVSKRNYLWNKTQMQDLYSANLSWSEVASLGVKELTPGATLTLNGGIDYLFSFGPEGDELYFEGPSYDIDSNGRIAHYQWNLKKFSLPAFPAQIYDRSGTLIDRNNESFAYLRDPTTGFFIWKQKAP